MPLALWLVRLYPRAWRRRYEAEMLAVLEQHHVTVVTVLDLFFGMVTARLDPHYGSESRLMILSSPRKATWLFLAVVGGFIVRAQTGYSTVDSRLQSVFVSANRFPSSCAPTTPPDMSYIGRVHGVVLETFVSCNTLPDSTPPLLPLVYLLVSALVIGGALYWAVTGRHWGFLALAVICFAAPVVVEAWLVQQPVVQRDVYEVTTPLGVLSVLGELEALMGVVFLSVVKGTQAITARRWRLLGLVLGVDLPLVVFLLALATASHASPLPGIPVIRQFDLYTAVLDLAALLLPFAAVGIMLLAFAGSAISKRVWHLVLGGASLLMCVMVFYLVSFVVYDINGWQMYGWPLLYLPSAIIGAELVLPILLALIALRAMVGAVVASSRAIGEAA